MSGVMVAAYVGFWAPYNILSLLYYFHAPARPTVAAHLDWLKYAAILNTILNPFLVPTSFASHSHSSHNWETHWSTDCERNQIGPAVAHPALPGSDLLYYFKTLRFRDA